MKKGLSLILLIIATQSYAAITWNCTSSDIKQSYLPKECTGVGSNSGSNNNSTSTPTTTKFVDMSGCLGSDQQASLKCAVDMADSFATNGRVVFIATAGCTPNKECSPYVELTNMDGTRDYIMPSTNMFLIPFSNYSEIPRNAAICNNKLGLS